LGDLLGADFMLDACNDFFTDLWESSELLLVPGNCDPQIAEMKEMRFELLEFIRRTISLKLNQKLRNSINVGMT
jgi:hypothetical protein